jgi:hypothetical protein
MSSSGMLRREDLIIRSTRHKIPEDGILRILNIVPNILGHFVMRRITVRFQ